MREAWFDVWMLILLEVPCLVGTGSLLLVCDATRNVRNVWWTCVVAFVRCSLRCKITVMCVWLIDLCNILV
jgi:hypothetical protein